MSVMQLLWAQASWRLTDGTDTMWGPDIYSHSCVAEQGLGAVHEVMHSFAACPSLPFAACPSLLALRVYVKLGIHVLTLACDVQQWRVTCAGHTPQTKASNAAQLSAPLMQPLSCSVLESACPLSCITPQSAACCTAPHVVLRGMHACRCDCFKRPTLRLLVIATGSSYCRTPTTTL